MLSAVTITAGCKPPAVKVTDQPVPVIRETIGSGRIARNGSIVTIAYRGVDTRNHRELLSDNSYRFQLGAGTVIHAIDEGVVGMRVGGTRVIHCEPQKHWGRAGYGEGAIPPNTTINFHLELLSVE